MVQNRFFWPGEGYTSWGEPQADVGRAASSLPVVAPHRGSRASRVFAGARTRVSGRLRGLQTMLPGGQLGGGPPPGREALAGAPGQLRRLPAPRLHATGQIDAVDGPVLGG